MGERRVAVEVHRSVHSACSLSSWGVRLITVVIASNRERCLSEWFSRWPADLRDARVVVVEDNPTRTFTMPGFYSHVEHYAWDDIERDLGDAAWVIPRRSSAVKSYGFWKARDSDVIWTLDDDCYPDKDRAGFYLRLIEEILGSHAPSAQWHNTIEGSGFFPRGYPYGGRRPVMVHHGLWSNIPDLDGVTALAHPDFRMEPAGKREIIPEGKFFPMCGMNLAFRRELLPAMYFMLMGHDNRGELFGFDRFDDIWAGLFVKKICDHFGWAVSSGFPSIVHTKESDPQERVRKEAPGIDAHESLWKIVADTDISGCTSVGGAYRVLAAEMSGAYLNEGYWGRLGEAMRIWAEICR